MAESSWWRFTFPIIGTIGLVGVAAGADFPEPYNSEPDTSAAPMARRGRRPDGVARRVPGHGVRRRAGCAEPHRDDLGRPRATVGRRELHLRRADAAVRPLAAGPRADLRRQRRRRAARRPHRLHRRRPDAHRSGGRPRRRLADVPAPTPVRAGSGWRRRAGRAGRGRARRLHRRHRELPQLRQRPEVGAGRLALRALRRLMPRIARRAGHARGRAEDARRRPVAVPSDAQSRRGARQPARRTPGGTTGTLTARGSSSTPSTATSGT